jgi:hypothetical protein
MQTQNTKVKQLKSSKTGRPVVNQFEIFKSTKKVSTYIFQSYNTTIAKVIFKNYKTFIILDKNALNYSKTSSKYLYQFLQNFNLFNLRNTTNKKETILKAIKNKEIQTKNLN